MELSITKSIQSVDQFELYKYLGTNEGGSIEHSKIKEKICKEYLIPKGKNGTKLRIKCC